MVVSDNISWIYIAFGIASAAIVSITSFRLKLIEEKSELLYLSIGFYRHFIKIFLGNFLSSIKLIIKLAITSKPLHPILYHVKIDPENKFNYALLIVTCNMSSGLICAGFKEGEVAIHAIEESYFAKLNLRKICHSLEKVNDDNLV